MEADGYRVHWIDTAETPQNADEKRTKYAGMVYKNGLANRYSVDILTVIMYGVEEHRILLIDQAPDEPAPAFLRDPAFVLERSREHKDHVPDDDFYTGERATNQGPTKRTIRNAVYVYNGEEHTLADWARTADIPYHTLYQRMVMMRWPIGQALTTPVQKRQKKAG